MIKVLEKLKSKSGELLLVCEMFDDGVVTKRLKSNVGEYTDFCVYSVPGCFSEPKGRAIAVRNSDINLIDSIEFVEFI